jgi:hypothetical protein
MVYFRAENIRWTFLVCDDCDPGDEPDEPWVCDICEEPYVFLENITVCILCAANMGICQVCKIQIIEMVDDGC